MSIKATDILEFKTTVMNIAAECDARDKDELEKLSRMLHEAVENAIEGFADDLEIEDYDPQY